MLKQKMCKNLTQDVPQKDPGPPTAGLQITNADFIFLFFFFQNQPDSPISSQKKKLIKIRVPKKELYSLYFHIIFLERQWTSLQLSQAH